MANGYIPDSSITASSHLSADHMPKYARLGGNKYWESLADDTSPWIQVDLGSRYTVIGLQTEGHYWSDKYQYWVTQIKVQVGMTEHDLSFIDDSQGKPKVC